MALGGRQTCRKDASTEAQRRVFVRCKQVPWQELVPFGILAGGWAREMALGVPLFPAKLSSVVLGSTTLPPLSSSLPAF